MDPFSTILGALQIAGQCAQALNALAKYINQVVTADKRIQSFYEDLTKLEQTYNTLQQCRGSPRMIAAAKAADEFTEQLWAHLATTLRDCENTLVAINLILGSINRPLGLSNQLRQVLERPIKQLREQLYGGELGRHHEKIKMFNTSLALPIQMITITLQLNQQDLSENHQRRLETRLMEMQGTIDSLRTILAELQRPVAFKRSSTFGSGRSGGTLVDSQNSEKEVCEHMEKFASSVKRFHLNASSVASTRSATSTIQLPTNLMLRGTSESGVPLTPKEVKNIIAWAPTLQEEFDEPIDPSETNPSPSSDYDEDSADEQDFELDLVRTYFENGQGDFEQDDFAAAEENFTEALQILEKNDFGERLAFQLADVVLMLTNCYVEQNKLDEAIEMLLPLTENGLTDDAASGLITSDKIPLNKSKRRPDHGRRLAAHHTLGNVYLKKQDFENAEQHSLCAFKGRSRLLGKSHEKTIESVHLVVNTYTTMGKAAKARAFSKYLTPEMDQIRRTSTNTTIATLRRQSVSKVMAAPDRPRNLLSLSNAPPAHSTSDNTSPKDSVESHQSLNQEPHSLQHPTSPSLEDNESTISSLPTSVLVRRTDSIISEQNLQPSFNNIKIVAMTSKDKACNVAHRLLKLYDPEPSKILIHRWDDIKKNIKKHGVEMGLAGTGQGYAAIHFFCELKQECTAEVKMLIDDGVDLFAVRYRAGYGKQEPLTPLQMAIERNHQTIAVTILEALQKQHIPATQIMSLRDSSDFSPLLSACRQGQIETVKHLLNYGAGIPLKFPRFWVGNSLLHDAASRCDTDMVKFLLSLDPPESSRHEIGAVNQRDQFGKTPLIYAVISRNIHNPVKREQKLRGRMACVEGLLARVVGVEGLTVRDTVNKDVFEYAREEEDEVLMGLLMGYAGFGTGE